MRGGGVKGDMGEGQKVNEPGYELWLFCFTAKYPKANENQRPLDEHHE